MSARTVTQFNRTISYLPYFYTWPNDMICPYAYLREKTPYIIYTIRTNDSCLLINRKTTARDLQAIRKTIQKRLAAIQQLYSSGNYSI